MSTLNVALVGDFMNITVWKVSGDDVPSGAYALYCKDDQRVSYIDAVGVDHTLITQSIRDKLVGNLS